MSNPEKLGVFFIIWSPGILKVSIQKEEDVFSEVISDLLYSAFL